MNASGDSPEVELLRRSFEAAAGALRVQSPKPVVDPPEQRVVRLVPFERSDPVDPERQSALFYLYSHDLAALRDQLLAAGSKPERSRTGAPARVRRCA